MIVFLVRHGEPDWAAADALGLAGHRRDFVTLTPRGVRQIQQAAADARLARAKVVLTSPYARTMHSAHILSRTLDLPMIPEWGLHEWLPDYRADNPEAWAAAAETWRRIVEMDGRYPPADRRIWESPDEMKQRAVAALSKYAGLDCVIAVTHAGVIYSLTRDRDGVDHGEIVQLHLPEGASGP